MDEPRLAREAPHLVEVLRRATPQQRRRAACAACRIAAAAVHPLPSAAVEQGLLALAAPAGPADSDRRDALRPLVQELNATHRRLELNGATERDSVMKTATAFAQARAAQALLLALGDDSLHAACEAIYEAQAAGVSARDLQVAVMTAVRTPQSTNADTSS